MYDNLFPMNSLAFSLPEVLSLIGVVQCTYLAVHISFRFGRLPRVVLPFLYFMILGLAFLADFGMQRLSPFLSGNGDTLFFYIQWALWFSGPPLSVLLVMQLADMFRKPWPGYGWLLFLLPLGLLFVSLATAGMEEGCGIFRPCPALKDMLVVTGLMAGAISLLVIFSKRGLLENISKQKFGRVRYWLVFSIVVLNTLFLAVMLGGLAGELDKSQIVMIRNVLGLGFVYLVGTGFLRAYPYDTKPPSLATTAESEDLNEAERELARRIEALLDLEKIYQEPAYSRADLARECMVSESAVSRVINIHFRKSFPQLINERRVEDARRLLLETDAPVRVICAEVGFNSLPSFNRAFREITGVSPGEFRKNASSGMS